MKQIKLSDINILDIGNEIQMCGTIWSGKGICFVTQIPDKDEDLTNLQKLVLSLDDWQTLLRQTDILETEMFTPDENGKIVKTLFRKSQRQIDAYIQWAVFQRDNYKCRYCGRTGIPLTVDHVDLYEEGGATTERNLISACKNCNKDRGRTYYDDWLKSSKYIRVSNNLTEEEKQKNLDVIDTLEDLKKLRVINIRTR